MITRLYNISLFAFIIAYAFPTANAAQDASSKAADDDVVVMSPFQVLASSVDLRANFKTRGGKKLLKYIFVKSVAPTSIAAKAGLKEKDIIVAIGELRLEGLELSALANGISLKWKYEGDVPFMTYTVRRARTKGEIIITLRFPKYKKETSQPEPARMSNGPEN